VPPALDVLLADPEAKIDAFLLPGHVSAIIGEAPYAFVAERYHVPSVITGFEPADILGALLDIVAMRREGRPAIHNTYTRVVAANGNPVARAVMNEVFAPADALWRGLGAFPKAGWPSARPMPILTPPGRWRHAPRCAALPAVAAAKSSRASCRPTCARFSARPAPRPAGGAVHGLHRRRLRRLLQISAGRVEEASLRRPGEALPSWTSPPGGSSPRTPGTNVSAMQRITH